MGVYYDAVIGSVLSIHLRLFTSDPVLRRSIPTHLERTFRHGRQGIWFSDECSRIAVDPELRRAHAPFSTRLGFEHEFKSVYSFGAQMVVYKDSSDGIGWQILDDGVL